MDGAARISPPSKRGAGTREKRRGVTCWGACGVEALTAGREWTACLAYPPRDGTNAGSHAASRLISLLLPHPAVPLYLCKHAAHPSRLCAVCYPGFFFGTHLARAPKLQPRRRSAPAFTRRRPAPLSRHGRARTQKSPRSRYLTIANCMRPVSACRLCLVATAPSTHWWEERWGRHGRRAEKYGPNLIRFKPAKELHALLPSPVGLLLMLAGHRSHGPAIATPRDPA